MRKMITLLAAAALVASSFAVAATGNSNDVLQQIQPNASATENPTTLADADTSGAPAAAPADASMDAAKPATTTHHPKHKHHYKHHCKTHHHKKAAPATTSDATPTTPAATTDTSTPAQ